MTLHFADLNSVKGKKTLDYSLTATVEQLTLSRKPFARMETNTLDLDFAEFENMDFLPFIKQDEDECIAATDASPWVGESEPGKILEILPEIALPDTTTTSPLGSPVSRLPPSPGLTEGYQSSDEPLTPAPVNMAGGQSDNDTGMMNTEQWMSNFGFNFDANADYLGEEMTADEAFAALCDTTKLEDMGVAGGEFMLDDSPLSPISTSGSDVQVDLAEEELLSLPVKELNTRLKGLPKDYVLQIKQKRRTLKNRGYAQNCRSRRLQQKSDLEKENATLRAQLRHSKQQALQVARERDLFKRQCAILGSRVHNMVKSRP